MAHSLGTDVKWVNYYQAPREESKMANRLLLGLAACAIPTAVSWGAELKPMKLESSQPPAPKSTSDRLVDAVIPAYGVRDSSPYRLSSRMNTLFRQVQLFTGHVDAMVMSNDLAIPDDGYEYLPEEQFPAAARPRLVKAQLLPQQQQLVEMMAEVMKFEEATPLPNHYERWHINTAYRDIYRAGEHLALAIDDQRFAHLRDLHRAWKDYYHRLVQAQVVEIMASLVPLEPENPEDKLPAPNLDELLQIALTKVTPIPWPQMSLDIEANPYPEVFLSSIPRWSEVDEEMRQRFINRFGVPGQALTPFFPTTEEPEVPVEAGETEAIEVEVTLEIPVEESADSPAEEPSEGAAEIEADVEVDAVEVEEAEEPAIAPEEEAVEVETVEPVAEPEAVAPPSEETEEPEDIEVDDLEIEMEDLELDLE